MKLIIKNDNRDIVKNPNIKIIKTTESAFTNQVVILENNDVPIIKYTDTESMYFIKDLDNLYDRKSKSEVLLDINTINLELIGGSTINDFIPLSGTAEGNPVTGDIEIVPSKGILFNDLEDSGTILKLMQEAGLIQILQDGVPVLKIGANFVILGSSVLVNDDDHSEIEPSNKLIYAQRSYVDKANSYSTDEILTGGTWIDDKPIYRKVLTKVVNTQTDSIPFDFENKEIIKQEVLFQDYMGYGVGHINQFQQGAEIDVRAYLYPDDGALLIRNINTSNVPTELHYQEVKVIAIIEYTKTTD